MRFLSIACLCILSLAALDARNIEDSSENGQKNIIFVLIDDLGFNDASFRGNNEILTPNIDALFYKGVSLDRYYTSPLCTPTRASLLTGNLAHHNGMYNEVVWNHQPWGLGLDQKLFPEYLKEVGYDTHILGKWHLGLFQEQYWPNNRGFDTFFGNLGVYVDYFTRNFAVPPSNFGPNNYTLGYDFRNNFDIDRTDEGMYMTDLLTKRTVDIIENSEKPFFIYLAHSAMHRANDDNPLPAKEEDLALFPHITDPERKHYAAMVKSVDDSLGEIIESLTKSGKMKDTIIAITSDNGGPTAFRIVHPNTASNYPLRGMKGLSWEGGIRVPCALYAPWIPSGKIVENLFHVTDWLPTLTSLANSGVNFDRKIDGMDLSEMILNNNGPFRKTVETIDIIYKTTSVIYEDMKLVNSSFAPLGGAPDVWLGSNNNADHDSANYIKRVQKSKVAKNLERFGEPLTKDVIQKRRAGYKFTCPDEITPCNALQEPCLFNIFKDPCERVNLANDPQYATTLAEMKERIVDMTARTVPPRNRGGRQGDYQSDPINHGGIWTAWQPNGPAY